MIQIENFAPRRLLVVFILSLICGSLLIGWAERTSVFPGDLPIGVDIYPRWVGSRAFWNGESPYTPVVERETQQYVYGRAAGPGDDTYGFYYPAHTAVVLAPISLLPPTVAAIFWSALSWAFLSLFAFLIMQSMPGRTPLWAGIVVALTVFFQRSALLVVLNGQYALFIMALWGGAYYLMRRNHDVSSGILLALTTIKPTLSFLPLLVFLFWALRNGRAKIVLSFLLTSALFFVISLMQIGWWVPGFLTQLTQYEDFPRQWVVGNIVTVSGLIWLGGTLVLLFVGVQFHRQNRQDFPWVLLWGAISLSLLVTPHTAEYDIVILLLPLILYAPTFLQSKTAVAVWLFLWWLPWLTWGLFQRWGYGTGTWLAVFWWHLPQIWVMFLVAFIFLNRSRQPVATIDQRVIP